MLWVTKSPSAQEVVYGSLNRCRLNRHAGGEVNVISPRVAVGQSEPINEDAASRAGYWTDATLEIDRSRWSTPQRPS